MASTHDTPTVSALHGAQDADLTLKNLLQALSLALDLRSHYRVYELEAAQDGHEACARLFADLQDVEGRQVARLLAGLRARLGSEASTASR
jgi:hypothetical protein